jgi:CRISPR-associated protein Cmr6
MTTYRDSLACIYQILTRPEYASTAHAGLWLDKYIKDQSRDDTKSRRELVEYVCPLAIPREYKGFYNRWKAMLCSDYGARVREARVKGRMIVGLSDESVLETSIKLHRTYGVPYIPGSALKGLAASYARQKLEGQGWRRGGEHYNVIFGDSGNASYITFFDALYIPPKNGHNGKALYPDVITVHHKDYYQNKDDSAPADWDSPTPIPFIAATGSYLVALAAPDLEPGLRDAWINTTFEILGLALKNMGIGARTSSGYGRMELEASAK